jgi:hypothetical protein
MIGFLKRLRNHRDFLKYQKTEGINVPDAPHFDPASLPYFLNALDQAQTYLEFGSGGSTREVARRNIPAVSVESDAGFAQAVRTAIGPNASVQVLDADIGVTTSWGEPLFNAPRYGRPKRWRSYLDPAFTKVCALAHFPDLVLVDGRFRRACALETARQALMVGATTEIFFDDYDGRPFYQPVEEYLGRPKLVGRAAIFSISGSLPGRPIGPADVDLALRDFR